MWIPNPSHLHHQARLYHQTPYPCLSPQWPHETQRICYASQQSFSKAYNWQPRSCSQITYQSTRLLLWMDPNDRQIYAILQNCTHMATVGVKGILGLWRHCSSYWTSELFCNVSSAVLCRRRGRQMFAWIRSLLYSVAGWLLVVIQLASFVKPVAHSEMKLKQNTETVLGFFQPHCHIFQHTNKC